MKGKIKTASTDILLPANPFLAIISYLILNRYLMPFLPFSYSYLGSHFFLL